MARNVPEDLEQPWLNLARRLKSIACQERGQRGAAFLHVAVLVDGNGVPVGYTEPQMVKMEPRSKEYEILETAPVHPLNSSPAG